MFLLLRYCCFTESSPILLALGLLYTVASMISYIVQEKELRQKELMKMMSVTEWDIESSWFCTFLLLNFLSASLATFVSSFLFSYSSPYILWLFWMLVFLSITLFATALATFCSKATRGVLLGLLVFFSGVFFAIALDPSRVSAATIHIVTLHPSASFCYGIKLLGNLEDVRIGASWDTMHLAALGADFSFAKVLGCLAYSCVFWAILTWYFNRVMKPDYGQALPFWFAFSPAYWKSFVIDDTTKDTEAPSDAASSSTVTSRSDAGSNEIPVEPVSAALRRQAAEGKSIEIVNLRKSFGDKTAVNGLNLSMYGGQITALLGHNGAGKTTTINMLTGAMAPTSGTATIAGKDIRTQMTEIRRDVGVCMQHDCLFPKLTVREHVEFFSRLKGVYREFSKEEADKHVDQAIEDVALSEKRHTRTANLSGGMKRKLSVAIAFCGKSKLVILDEPTSGMDPFSRRFTWNVIRHYRQDRIIILTTHFMDEADILGDRIAIMAEGQLRCAGSSLYLKKIYGVGYQLTIEKNQVIGHPPHGGVTSKAYHGLNVDQSDAESIEVSEDECIDEHNQGVLSPDTCKRNGGEFASSEKLKKIVVGAVSDAKLLGDVGSELSYQLPLGSASKFTSMFELLDEEVGKGSISCYGVGITTLDEVFVKVTRGEQPKQETSLASSRMGSKELLLSADEPPFLVDESGYSSVIQLEDEGLFLRHLQALLKKRAAIFRRDKKAWLFTTILPSFFVLLGFLLFTMVAIDRDLEPVNLDASRLNDDLDVRRHHDKVLRPSSATPISVNSPGNPFLCQVGTCSHKRPFVQENSTNETYFFCGFQAKLGINTSGYVPTNNTCTVTESSHIMNSVADSNTVIEEVSVRNVSEVSHLVSNF